ncbi:hypothetical protein [Flaviflagellibacter deserti]|uniref:Uncharacterized protein n=1 Tax=Flaviflagellibacter deserti TaxID=2267266 RepID=A0ABV9Z7J9_9HYPH
MPKAKMTNVVGVTVQAKAGTFSILGKDSAGREIEFELPLDAMKRLAAETRRASMLHPGPSLVPKDAKPGEWGQVVPLDIRTAAVGTLSPPAGPAVAIVFDQGHETEIAFRIPGDGAKHLGELMIKESEKLKG